MQNSLHLSRLLTRGKYFVPNTASDSKTEVKNARSLKYAFSQYINAASKDGVVRKSHFQESQAAG